MSKSSSRASRGTSTAKANDDVSAELHGSRYFTVVEGSIGLLDGGVRL